MNKKNARTWLQTIIRNEWIGKATLAGLTEAMNDLDYTWGVPEHANTPDIALKGVADEKGYPVKLAA